jgi:hypothetical protein
MKELTCGWCGRKFKRSWKAKHCSQACAKAKQYGHKPTPEILSEDENDNYCRTTWPDTKRLFTPKQWRRLRVVAEAARAARGMT